MFQFFTNPKWWWWSYFGMLVIVVAVWFNVQLDVRINQWFGKFYDVLQKALSPGSLVTINEFNGYILEFFSIAGVYIIVSVVFRGFLVNHWVFRWRQSMAEYYRDNWEKARHIEGASQRLQEDTLKFSRITETLGFGLLEALFTLISFIPILYGLSSVVTELPILGKVDNSLVWVVVTACLGGTVLLSLIGSKLPGIEYDIQKNEAAYRKELVYGEDNLDRAEKGVINLLFSQVRSIHFKSYLHYFYFNIATWSYLQAMIVVPYFVLGPTIITGAITLGVVSQTVRAFGRVAENLQYVIRSWLSIVEFISVYKRLKEFERQF